MVASETPEADRDAVDAVGLVSALRRQAQDVTALIAADAELAGVSLVAMINGLVLAGLSALTAWGLLMALVVWWVADAGLPLGPVLGVLALLHVVVALVLWARTMRLARHLGFRATRRQLRLADGDGGG